MITQSAYQKLAALLVTGLVLMPLVAGCGGGADPSNSVGKEGRTDASAAFLRPNDPSTDKLVKFGAEAPAEVREEASAVLTRNLKAREAAEFETQCATLAQKPIARITGAKGPEASKSCAKDLRKEAEPLSSSLPFRTNQLSGPISALRLEGNKGYALFHGMDSDDYAMPMIKEGPEWKVASILTIKLGND